MPHRLDRIKKYTIKSLKCYQIYQALSSVYSVLTAVYSVLTAVYRSKLSIAGKESGKESNKVAAVVLEKTL